MINTVVTCDKCGDQIFFFVILGNTHAIRLARNNGWTMGKQHLCPKCNKKKGCMPVAYKEGKHE